MSDTTPRVPVEPCTHPEDQVRVVQIWNDRGEIIADVGRCGDCGAIL